MAQKATQTIKGCRKCGRKKRKDAGRGGALSLFVRGKISGEDYLKLTGQKLKS